MRDLKIIFQENLLEAKNTEFDIYKLVSPKNSERPILQGVYYKDGYAIADDGFVIVASKSAYKSEYEGKIIDNEGNEIHGKYPNVETMLDISNYKGTKKIKLRKISDINKSLREAQKDAKDKGLKKYDFATIIQVADNVWVRDNRIKQLGIVTSLNGDFWVGDIFDNYANQTSLFMMNKNGDKAVITTANSEIHKEIVNETDNWKTFRINDY